MELKLLLNFREIILDYLAGYNAITPALKSRMGKQKSQKDIMEEEEGKIRKQETDSTHRPNHCCTGRPHGKHERNASSH